MTNFANISNNEEALNAITTLEKELSAKLGIPVAAVAECGESARSIGAEVRRLLAANARLRGLFVTSSFAASVVAALADSRRRVTVVAADFTRPAQEALRSGGVAALLYPSPERQVQAALEGLCAYLGTGEAAASVAIRQELVLKSNLESYL